MIYNNIHIIIIDNNNIFIHTNYFCCAKYLGYKLLKLERII